MINVLTWLWRQPGSRIEYTTAHVNGWAKAIRESATIPITVSCVTDIPEGLDESIHVIAPPGDFMDVTSKTWPSSKGWPQCYRRLAMFRPDAAEIFGERFVCMDVDVLITGNLDKILSREEDFIIFRGTNLSKRPYNGGMIMMTAGCRPQVFTEFTAEKARESGKVYVGSDQAWISYCLGRGESVFDEKDGVTHYSPGWIRKCGNPPAFTFPVDTKILFFPGNVKVFPGSTEIWGGTTKDREILPKVFDHVCPNWRPKPLPPRHLSAKKQLSAMKKELVMKKTLYAYNDPKGWGVFFAKACESAGIPCRVFASPSKVPDGSRCFVRIDQQGTQREISKGIVEALAKRNCVTLPTAQEAIWYDDKGLQSEYDVIGQWMTDTWFLQDPEEAEKKAKFIEDSDSLGFPIYSKAIDGAGSKCVRMINSYEEALTEIEQAFSDEGIPSAYTRRQQGYVYWQRFIPNAECTYRMTIIGDYILGHERQHDEGGLPIPGQNPFMLFDQDYQIELGKLTLEIAEHLKTKWMCFDFLQDEYGEFKVLEMSSAWPTKKWFSGAPVFNRHFEKTKMTGADMFKLAVDVLR